MPLLPPLAPCRDLDRVKAGLWGVAATHLAYSALTAALVCLYLLAHPSALWLTSAARTAASALPQALIAASAGFFGFVLWAEVNNRWAGQHGLRGGAVCAPPLGLPAANGGGKSGGLPLLRWPPSGGPAASPELGTCYWAWLVCWPSREATGQRGRPRPAAGATVPLAVHVPGSDKG
jgi:hypothetical protein